jgi:hypothetical protein
MSTKVLELGDPSISPETVTIEVRGNRFTFRELEIGEYDKLVKAATHQEADDDGIMQDVTDSTLLLRLMIPKSCIDPKLTPDAVSSMGSRGYRALARIVNELHYGDEPIKRIKDDDETPAEETPKGNA